MAAPALSQTDVKTLEQTRQRLSQLNSSLQSLLTQIHNTDPLPTWSHFTHLSTVISQNLAALSTLLSENKDVLSALATFPLPSYPGREQEALLEQLLRKKLEPDIEERVAAGRALGDSVDSQNREALRKLWEWSGMAANEQARKHHWGADYTSEEVEGGIEHVVTGLKRKLVPPDEDEDDDDEGDEDEDEDDDDEEAIEDGEEEADDGIEMVGIRRSSTTGGQVEFDVRGKSDSKGVAAKSAVPIQAQLRFMMTGK